MFLRDTKDDAPVEGGYKGAIVLEPQKGFYARAIISLDFASLYPTIMRQYNTSNETYSDTHMDDPRFYKHDNGCCFIKTSYYDGVLPAILGKLAKARKVYKKEMMRFEKLCHESVEGSKERADYAFMEKVANAKQLAAKVSMNSVYGFCGVQNNGKQPCLPLAAAVTTIGRQLIDKTKTFIEQYEPGSQVIYGDTDSVMVNIFPDRALDGDPTCIIDAFTKAEEIVTAIAPIYTFDSKNYIVLEFENVYAIFLLIVKKTYSALCYSAELGPNVPKKVVIKGLKCVRRDTNAHTRKSQASIIDSIAHNRISEALATGRSAVSNLFQGTVPFSDLVTSKKVGSQYKVVAKRLDGEKVKVFVTPFGKWTAVEGAANGTCIVKPGEDWTMLSSDGSTYGALRLALPHIHVLLRQEARVPGSAPRVGKAVIVSSIRPRVESGYCTS